MITQARKTLRGSLFLLPDLFFAVVTTYSVISNKGFSPATLSFIFMAMVIYRFVFVIVQSRARTKLWRISKTERESLIYKVSTYHSRSDIVLSLLLNILSAVMLSLLGLWIIALINLANVSNLAYATLGLWKDSKKMA